MKIKTKVFGPQELDDTQLVTMTEPLPGFPGLTHFAVLDPDPEHPFKWLQSVDRADVCFLIAEPAHFFPDYQVTLRAADLGDLSLSGDGDTAVAVVLNVPTDPTRATANLLAPIVFNSRKKLARQVILDGSGHSVRTPLFQEVKRVCNGV